MNKKNHYINLFVLAYMMVLAITSCQQELMPVQPEADSARTLTFTLNMPQGKPAFGEGQSRAATTGTWAEGDELMLNVGVHTDDSKNGTEAFLTLKYNEVGKWDVQTGKSYSVIVRSEGTVIKPYTELPVLTATQNLTLARDITLMLDEKLDMAKYLYHAEVYYAPEMEIAEVTDAAKLVLDPKENATTTAPEVWFATANSTENSVLDLQWSNNQARLRIYTGVAGDEVTLTSTAFAPNVAKPTDGTYIATTGTDGYANFYGTMAEQTSGFTVELSAVRMGEGDAAVTCPLSCVTLLKASNVVPVTLESDKSYKLDATGQRIAWTKSVAVIDGTTENIETNIKDAIADGKTTLYVTGTDMEKVKGGISGVRSGTVNLILPDAEEIGEKAFYECTALTSVNLPKATSIESRAFVNCNHLTSVNLPSATSIGYGAFDNCIALTNVNLPKVISITEYAFYGCSALTSVNLPKARSISPHTFYGCSSLTSLTFGSVIEYVTSFAFSYASTEQCDLTLAVGQTVGDPDVVNRTWVSYTWKSITIK